METPFNGYYKISVETENGNPIYLRVENGDSARAFYTAEGWAFEKASIGFMQESSPTTHHYPLSLRNWSFFNSITNDYGDFFSLPIVCVPSIAFFLINYFPLPSHFDYFIEKF